MNDLGDAPLRQQVRECRLAGGTVTVDTDKLTHHNLILPDAWPTT
jgi:hypothetical protein